MMKRLAVLAVAGLGLAACASAPPPPPPEPTGPQTFRLVTMMGRAPTFDGVTLVIDGTRANGSSGCNTYRAVHDPAPGAARPFGWFQVTRMACSDLQMAMEQQFLQVLDETRSVERNGPEMVLKGADGTELARLNRAPAAPRAPTS